MKLLILSVLAFGLTATASDPNNINQPKHLNKEFKSQTCAFAAKNTEAQKSVGRTDKNGNAIR